MDLQKHREQILSSSYLIMSLKVRGAASLAVGYSDITSALCETPGFTGSRKILGIIITWEDVGMK